MPLEPADLKPKSINWGLWIAIGLIISIYWFLLSWFVFRSILLSFFFSTLAFFMPMILVLIFYPKPPVDPVETMPQSAIRFMLKYPRRYANDSDRARWKKEQEKKRREREERRRRRAWGH